MSEHDPRMQRAMGKIATLERRADHLQRQIETGNHSPSAGSFIAAEKAALEGAIVAFRIHHAEVEGLARPIEIMGEMITALEKRADGDPELTRLLERASVAVVEFGASARAEQEGKDHDERFKSRAIG